VLKYLLNSKLVSNYLLKNIKAKKIREFYGEKFLSPIESFVLFGYNKKLYSDLDLDNQSTAIVLGGYLGYSAREIYENYACNIIIFEPVPEFAAVLKEKFSQAHIEIIQRAAGTEDNEINLVVDGESSGINCHGDLSINVQGVNFSRFVRETNNVIDLLEINIEGAEYDVILQLIETGEIGKIRILIVQFHNQKLEDEYRRALVRQKLRGSHVEVFCFPWVWEKWIIR
jgi:FkbM family methyltransferase